MASAFWILEDGRGFARSSAIMARMLALITDELAIIQGAGDFYHYLEPLVFREDRGDMPNGFGGFIRGEENIMFNFDLRSFTSENRAHFWRATQGALIQLIKEEEEFGFFFIILLDMHKRIKIGEDPMQLNHLRIIKEPPIEKLGPGWN